MYQVKRVISRGFKPLMYREREKRKERGEKKEKDRRKKKEKEEREKKGRIIL